MASEYVTLTDAELQERGRELAEKVVEAAKIKREKDNANKDFKLRLDIVNKEIADLTAVVTTGEEERETTLFTNQIG